ncbi:malto-oligosyltrehalose synthase [Devriesea agamarum]|uniref:malto-oligosyltrehalose synthase n=1 Tax=Devriesea agamarum TaxID=472569 RepID=UPI000AF9BFB5|nr:malto-oligosyltrehalose synthase [Devriesea agamarum]
MIRSSSIVPTSTYRLQIHGAFTFHDAAGLVPYLHELGITHLYLAPILQAAPGSTHGYDVVDHQRISQEAGGEEGLRELADIAHAHGMGLIADVVPNHMAIPSPLWHNHALWSLLRDGPTSRYANWFDIDVESGPPLLMPVLGDKIGTVLGRGDISVESISIPDPISGERVEDVVRYADHVFPVAAGTRSLPLTDLLDRQWYRLAYWKVADDELNYRRFFDVDTLAAIRVEVPEVFEATHATLRRLLHDGTIDGLRIDHPDGLANPRQYLRDLERATDGAWVVIEKILEGSETLPHDFACSGTTGYDAAWRITGLFHDPRGTEPLTRWWESMSGQRLGIADVITQAKKEIVTTSLFAEVDRLTSIACEICQDDIRLRDHTRRHLARAITALLCAMDRYRAYTVAGEPVPGHEREVLTAAAERAAATLDPDEHDTLDLILALACGDEAGSAGRTDAPQRTEFMVRFAQTCGPVRAKAVEDTAFYRYHRFLPVCEVGADPAVVGVDPDDVHEHFQRTIRTWPHTMTTLSTHDTKRSEDVRARLAALTELPHEWAFLVHELNDATAEESSAVDGATRALLWQTLAGTWAYPDHSGHELIPRISEERLIGYVEKAVREAKLHTCWTDPDQNYEHQVMTLARTALSSTRVHELLREWTQRTLPATRAVVLGQKLVQLTAPGIPDVYQGQEWLDFSLVDPDNRRSVDHNRHAERLRRMREGAGPESLADEKLWLVHRALGVRRALPDAFMSEAAGYTPIATTSGHAFAFARTCSNLSTRPSSQVISVVTRLPMGLAHRGGWGEHRIVLPEGDWFDALSGRSITGGSVPISRVLDASPVALLVRDPKILTDADRATDNAPACREIPADGEPS